MSREFQCALCQKCFHEACVHELATATFPLGCRCPQYSRHEVRPLALNIVIASWSCLVLGTLQGSLGLRMYVSLVHKTVRWPSKHVHSKLFISTNLECRLLFILKQCCAVALIFRSCWNIERGTLCVPWYMSNRIEHTMMCHGRL